MKSFLALMLVFVSAPAFSQMIQDPTTWKYEVKKKSATEYQVIYHLSLKPGWHIWSVKPGGDGYQIAPTFTPDKNAAVKTVGKITEKGKATTTTMEGIDGKVTYLSGKIDYMQTITVTGPTMLTGTHGYQVCNDKLCLPPKDVKFSVDLK